MTCIGVLCMRQGLLGLFVRRLGRLETVTAHANVEQVCGVAIFAKCSVDVEP